MKSSLDREGWKKEVDREREQVFGRLKERERETVVSWQLLEQDPSDLS